jgi:hypothetical protein
MWFSKNKWKSKLSDQVDKIIAQDIEIELGDLIKVVGATSTHDVILEMLAYIIAGDIKCRFVLYDVDGKIVKECSSIFEEPECLTSDWRAVYSKS